MDRCSPDSCYACPDRVVCRCLHVTEGELMEAIATRDLRTLREIKRVIGAGDGCTCCHAELQEYVARVSLAVV
jgi:bacterioferritin-associated ferredoxin